MKNIKLYILLLLTPFMLISLAAEDKSKQSFQDRQIMERIKLDIAELKGPPSVEDVKDKQMEAANDLLLVINSGRYKGKKLKRLKIMHERMINRPEPTQETVNKAHTAMIEQMNNKIKSHNNNFKNQNNNMRESKIQMREMRETTGNNPN
tara:strand:- start:408 stop:857 length:450 start_codon:yes stop_codon:yes gene_type:complete